MFKKNDDCDNMDSTDYIYLSRCIFREALDSGAITLDQKIPAKPEDFGVPSFVLDRNIRGVGGCK